MLKPERYENKLMKSQRTNSTFASSHTQAETSACKRAISCLRTRQKTD